MDYKSRLKNIEQTLKERLAVQSIFNPKFKDVSDKELNKMIRDFAEFDIKKYSIKDFADAVKVYEDMFAKDEIDFKDKEMLIDLIDKYFNSRYDFP